MSSESLHEDAERLGPLVTDQHRAIVSIMEELEAVDWYNQRAKATSDREPRAILGEGSITGIEAVAEHGGAAGVGVGEDGSLGIGSLRCVKTSAPNGEGAK